MGEGMDHIVLYLTLILDTRDSFLRTFSHFVFSSPLHNIHKILFNLHKIYNIRNRAEMTVIHTCQPHVIHASIISQNQLAHPVAIILGKLFVSLLDVHIEKKRKKERRRKKKKRNTQERSRDEQQGTVAGTRARRRTIDRGRCVTLTNLRRKLFAFSITLPSPLPRAEIDDSLFSHVSF